MNNYDELIFHKPICDKVVIEFNLFTNQSDFSIRHYQFMEKLNIHYKDSKVTDCSDKKFRTYYEHLGISLEVSIDKIKVTFGGSFFTRPGKTFKETYQEHHDIRKILESDIMISKANEDYEGWGFGIPKEIHIAQDVGNLNIYNYYHDDYSKELTIINSKSFDYALKSSGKEFLGSIYFKSGGSTKNREWECCLYDKLKEIKHYLSNIENQGSAHKVIKYYEELRYDEYEFLTRFELKLFSRQIKRNYLGEYFKTEDMDDFLSRVLTHFRKRHRFYYNDLERPLKDWELKDMRHTLKEHPLFSKIFDKKEDLEHQTFPDALYELPQLKQAKDLEDDFVNRCLKYNVELTEEFMSKIFSKALERTPEFIKAYKERKERRNDFKEWLKEHSPPMSPDKYDRFLNQFQQ